MTVHSKAAIISLQQLAIISLQKLAAAFITASFFLVVPPSILLIMGKQAVFWRDPLGNQVGYKGRRKCGLFKQEQMVGSRDMKGYLIFNRHHPEMECSPLCSIWSHSRMVFVWLPIHRTAPCHVTNRMAVYRSTPWR